MQPDAGQIEQFRRDGFLAIGPVVDDARIGRLREAFESLEAKWAAECGVDVARYRSVVSQWTGVWRQHPLLTEQLHWPAIESIARALLGVEQLQLFHDHVISKPPGHSSTVPWHQDYPFWPVDTPRALSCWLALDDAPAAAGALRFMPGAHLEGEEAPVDFLARNKDWGPREPDAHAVPVPAGWAIFHSCLSWHSSPPNSTEGPRRALISIYMDAACRWDPAHSGWHPMNEYVSVKPGEPFNADQFPIIRRSGSSR